LYLNGSYVQKRVKSPKGKVPEEELQKLINKLEKDKFGSKEAPKKHDSGKPRMDLVRPEFTLALADALAYGASKYEEQRGDIPNYLKGEGFHYSKIIASLERHIAAFKSGIDTDEESGRSHLALAAANLMFLSTYSLCDKGIDDRIRLGDLSNSESEKRFDSERSERRASSEATEQDKEAGEGESKA
jgi:hypothetical protein